MKALSKIFVFLAVLILAGCGGGGGGSNGNSGGGFNAGTYSLTITPGSTTLAQNAQTTITVGVKNPDGTVVSNGLSVSLSVTPVGIGTVGATAGTTGSTATAPTSGGSASFVFLSAAQGGTAHVTASVQNSNGTASTTSVDIAVSSTTTNDPRLQLTASTTTLPLNPFNPEDGSEGFPGNYLGSPYIAEVAVQWRHSNGQLVGGTLKANVSMSQVTVAGYSTLDDPTTAWTGETKTPPTAEGNEFLTILGSGTVDVTAGIGTIFVHSFDVPGTSVLTVTAVDPDTNQTISSQLTITVQGAATNKLPGAVSISQADGGVYVNGSNGAQSKVVSAIVLDGNGALVADPTDGQGHSWDNVQFQIVGPAGVDAKLNALNAAGTSQTGTTVVTSTHNGIASVSFQAGTLQGPVQIKATVDRGDNNVDNQIQDPISATATVIVSDGILYSLTFTSPGSLAPSIVINRVSASVSLETQGTAIPPDPNATYSFTVSAIGTDRQQNPVLPGTVIRFGGVDTPQSNFGFSISGSQGDPSEGKTSFTALDGHFVTAGGGAGPGDTLIVFGKADPASGTSAPSAPIGNDDLESAVKITAVNSQTSLTVATPFNFNDTTGAVYNAGPVLPYIVGRASIGNISSPASTDAKGVASTTLNYPVSALGRVIALYAQGTGTDTVNGSTKVVTDAALMVFPGVAPANIVVSPNPIAGNITEPVTVCIYDALGSPLPGTAFTFVFANLGLGTGSVDGISNTGTTQGITDASGCAVTTVKTSGIASSSSGSGTPSLTFSAGSATSGPIPITSGGGLALLANPSSCQGEGCSVTLTLVDAGGNPVPGAQITGVCSGDSSVGISQGPTVTNASGVSNATITADLDAYGSAKSGACTFSTTASGGPTATVRLQGVDLCLSDPTNTNCTSSSGGSNVTLSVTVDASAGGPTATGEVDTATTGSGFSPGNSLTGSCKVLATDTTKSKTCFFSVASGASVSLTAIGANWVPPWTGACSGTSPSTAIVVTAAVVCTATFN